MVEIIYHNGKFELVPKCLFPAILKLKKKDIYRYRYL
jgi:hypothetical protein